MSLRDKILNTKMVIYCFTNKINGKQYIGQTRSSLRTRLNSHIYNSKNISKNAPIISKAINKYGMSNFSLKILFVGNSIEELNKMEEEYILKLNTLSPNGYNIRKGGANFEYCEEHLSTIRVSHNTPHYIEKIKNTKDSKKISQTMKQKYLDPEFKKKMKEISIKTVTDPDIKQKIKISISTEFCKHGELDTSLLQFILDLHCAGCSGREMAKVFKDNGIKSLKGEEIGWYTINKLIRHMKLDINAK